MIKVELPTVWIDEREERETGISKLIDANRVQVEIDLMDDSMGGDFVWIGNALDGTYLYAAAEKKKIGELCGLIIGTSRHLEQLERMATHYANTYLIIEGDWRYGPSGHVEEFIAPHTFRPGRLGKPDWYPVKPSTKNRTLRKHIIGLEARFGTRVKLTKNSQQTADEITDLVDWWDTPLEHHESVMKNSTPFNIKGNWGLCARMFKELDGVGFVLSRVLASKFTSPSAMNDATVEDIAEIKLPVGKTGKYRRVGEVTAKKIIDQWNGRWENT